MWLLVRAVSKQKKSIEAFIAGSKRATLWSSWTAENGFDNISVIEFIFVGTAHDKNWYQFECCSFEKIFFLYLLNTLTFFLCQQCSWGEKVCAKWIKILHWYLAACLRKLLFVLRCSTLNHLKIQDEANSDFKSQFCRHLKTWKLWSLTVTVMLLQKAQLFFSSRHLDMVTSTAY